MNLLLIRKWFTDKGTEGELYLGGTFLCYTLEDQTRDGDIFQVKVKGDTAIPYGKYRVTAENSPRFGPDTLTINAVPNFIGVRIHAGNKPEDTDGCLLVGLLRTAPTDALIGQSKAALALLKDSLLPHLKSGETCWLHIVDGRIIAEGHRP